MRHAENKEPRVFAEFSVGDSQVASLHKIVRVPHIENYMYLAIL